MTLQFELRPDDRALLVEFLLSMGAFVVILLAVALLPPGQPVRAAAGLFGVLLLPGYAVTTMVFPGESAAAQSTTPLGSVVFRTDGATSPASLSHVERGCLSFGLSIALVPVYGYLAAMLDVGFGDGLATQIVVVTTFLLIVAGTLRRLSVPRDARYTLPVERWRHDLSELTSNGSRATLVLAVAVLLAGVSFVGAFAAPMDGSTYTQTSLLTERDGELTAGPYQTSFERGETSSLVIELTNREGQTVEYTVVLRVVRLGPDGSIESAERLDRFDRTLGAGETARIDHTARAALTGDRVRFSYLIYHGEPPAEISPETADDRLWLEIDVEA